LVHGWEGRGAQLGALAEAVARRGLRAVFFDAPGHGESTAARASVVEHARAIVAVAETLGPIHGVITHSVGGPAALLSTRMGFRATRFALLAPPTSPRRFVHGFRRMLDMDAAVFDAMIERLEARYAMRFEDLDVTSDAAQLSAPLLVVHDRADSIVPFADGEALARAAPRGELVATERLGHTRVLRDPQVIARLADFATAGAPGAVAVPSFAESLDGYLFLRDSR
jgi:pimeloyl-ACP methyl ester carboxylesterase